MKTKKEEKLYRGSEWTKWDLHMHTPASNGDKSDNWVNEFVEVLNSSDVEVFAITDYFTLDGYKALLQHKDKIKKSLFPGIELRLEDSILPSRHRNQKKKTARPIHVQIIFDNEDQFLPKIQEFVRSLQFKNFEDVSNDLTRENIIKVGLQKNSSLSNDDAYIEGCRQIRISKDQIKNKLKEKGIEERALIILPYEKYGGIDEIDPHTDSLIKSRLTKFADVIESSQEKQREFFLGKSPKLPYLLRNEKENDDFKNYIGMPKPCITGSDAHNLDNIGIFPNQMNCWIKADPTFEGLKQIVYEPQFRVWIGARPPLYLHPQIVSFQLEGITEYQDKKSIDLFPPISLKKQISFSPNLTTIIGPRASGKTVLVELLSYIFNKHSMDAKNGKAALVPFLAENFPKLIVKILYQQGEKEAEIVRREIVNLSDPFYTSPLNIEYWSQGEIEKVADKKEKIAEYIKDRLESNLLSNISLEIDKLKKRLEGLRNKYINKFEVVIEQKNLSAEKKQIEEYFEKLKTKEYKDLVKRMRENRAKTQLLDTFIESLEATIELLEESKKRINFTNMPDKKKVLEVFTENSLLRSQIEEFYEFTNVDLINIITKFKELKDSLERSKERGDFAKQALQLKKKFFDYCGKNDINISQTEYEKRTNRLTIINQHLRELQSKLKEYEAARQSHIQFARKLKETLGEWRKENNRIIRQFNTTFSNSNIQVLWEDPSDRLSEWIASRFLASDSATKTLIKEHYHVSSPAREDFVREIIKELVINTKCSIDKIIGYLKDKEVPPLAESGGKEENLKWFFQRNETEILREDLIMRLQEYGEKGVNLIQYKNKILGKHRMSFGERCGTLIELILYSGDHPLIIDQPEEHLDAKFIADRVVDIIREQKIIRQIIICTHNANIVVLGDSELITALSVDEQGTDSCQGSLESPSTRKQIYDTLEGGPEAFKKRERKYRIIRKE